MLHNANKDFLHHVLSFLCVTKDRVGYAEEQRGIRIHDCC